MTQPLVCWNCGRDLDDLPLPLSRQATCGDCFNSLHCCRMCSHYAQGRPGQCDEDRADPPLIKENANFCEYFTPQRGVFRAESRGRQDAARERFASLFGGQSHDDDGQGGADAAKDPDDPLSRLNDLFGDQRQE